MSGRTERDTTRIRLALAQITIINIFIKLL
jgi:hypothetical protein